MYLNLPFWFSNQYSSAFPLVSLQYNNLHLKFELRDYTELLKITTKNIDIDQLISKYNFVELIENNLNELNVSMVIEYIALDTFERQRFIQSGHEYIINEINEVEFKNINQLNTDLVLNFHHCIRDIRWYVTPQITTNTYFTPYPVNDHYYRKKSILSSDNVYYENYIQSFNPEYITNTYNTLNIEYTTEILWKNNTINTDKINDDYDRANYIKIYPYCVSTRLTLNSYVLFNQPYMYFNYLQPYNYYPTTPFLGSNVYSFSLYPNEITPTGSFNIGRISYVSIKPFLYFSENNDDGIPNEYTIKIMVTTINVLRIIGGICNKAYHY